MTSRLREVVVVGASAGGVEALRATVGGLPTGLRASVLVVLHMRADAVTALPAILSRSGPLPAHTARHGEPMEPGQIYTAKPDHHLVVVGQVLELLHGPSERGHRPSINILFRSAATALGPAVTGVLLSGMLEDGVAGLVAITALGGRTIVQDPADAIFPNLPVHALRAFTPDHVVRAADIGAVLADDQTQTGTEPRRPPA
jgi:two-component system, chemotaxis family, protein-glutamate methylesterase/glutaminase